MDFKKAPIFTSGSLPMNRETSQQFKTFGAMGAPTSIGDLRISMVNPVITPFLTMVSYIWAFIIGFTRESDIDTMVTGTLPPTGESYDLSPRPQLVVTISPKGGEQKVSDLISAGFSARSNGRYKYYMGPGTDSAMRAAIPLGVTTDAHAPGNAVSINGLILYTLMSRVVTLAFGFLYRLPSLTMDGKKAKYDKNYRGWKLTESKLAELPTKGHFFPYFDGLLLPDQGSTITTFLNLFSKLMGKPNQLAQALRVCGSGWTTLNNTAAGKEFSHMLFCIKQALSSGVQMRPVYLNDRYAGCVFYTESALVHVGSSVYVPMDTAGIREGLESLRSHDSALAEICVILSGIPLTEGNKEVVVDPLSIISSRHLHNQFRIRSLGPDTTAKLTLLMRKMRFEQQLWDVSNPDHVRKAVQLICKKEFPTTDVPMNLRVDCVYSKKPIYSVLGAFGTKAPSLRGYGSSIVRRITKEAYPSLDKPGRLVGIPVFAKSHNEAKEDWEGVTTDYTVFFDSKGKDKEGKLRIKGLSSQIPFDSEPGKAVINALADLVKDTKKRKEREEEPGLTAEELAQRAKAQRRREKGYGMLGLSFDLPQAEGSNMDVDDDAEDIYA